MKAAPALFSIWILVTTSASLAADKFEYLVVFLAGTMEQPKLVSHSSGALVDKDKSEALNKLGKEGWEVISVTGAAGADHAVYLKRPAK